jgi:hypothetical protein
MITKAVNFLNSKPLVAVVVGLSLFAIITRLMKR